MIKLDENSIKKIKYWYINELKDLIEIVLKGEAEVIEGKRRYEIVENIIEEYGDKDFFKEFIKNFDSLKNISINKAVNCLIEHFYIPISEARSIERRSVLILMIYKHGLVEKLNFIRFISSFEQYRNETGYFLRIKPPKDINDNLEKSITEFYQEWNENNKDFIFAEIIPTDEDFIPLRITKEIGRRFQREFTFRLRKKPPYSSLDPNEFKTESLENFPVSYRNISIKKVSEDLYELIFNFKINREKRLIESCLTHIFGLNIEISQLEYAKSDILKNVEEITKNLFEEFKSESFNKVRERFNEIQNQAIKKINRLGESTEKKDKLRNIVRNTILLPPKIFDVVEKGIIKIDLDIEPEDFTKDPRGKRIIEDLYKLSNDITEDKKIYIYSVNGKRIELNQKNIYNEFANLNELEQKALKLIFGVED